MNGVEVFAEGSRAEQAHRGKLVLRLVPTGGNLPFASEGGGVLVAFADGRPLDPSAETVAIQAAVEKWGGSWRSVAITRCEFLGYPEIES